VATGLFGASSVVVELQDALNTIWHVPHKSSCGILSSMVAFTRERFFSFLIVLGAGILLLLSVAVSAGIEALGRFFGRQLLIPEMVLHSVTFLVSLVTIALIFATLYKVLPDVRLKWRDVMVGACVTSLLFTIGKQLIAIYLVRASFASAYGAAGSALIITVWVYYSAQLFFLGAEFTKVYSQDMGSQIGRQPVSEQMFTSQQIAQP